MLTSIVRAGDGVIVSIVCTRVDALKMWVRCDMFPFSPLLVDCWGRRTPHAYQGTLSRINDLLAEANMKLCLPLKKK